MHSVSSGGTVPSTAGARCSICSARGRILAVKSPMAGLWGTDGPRGLQRALLPLSATSISCLSPHGAHSGTAGTSDTRHGNSPGPGNSAWAQPRQGKGQRWHRILWRRGCQGLLYAAIWNGLTIPLYWLPVNSYCSNYSTIPPGLVPFFRDFSLKPGPVQWLETDLS